MPAGGDLIVGTRQYAIDERGLPNSPAALPEIMFG